MPAVTTFPSTAEVVIIGGGAVGLSVAYALAQRGVAAVVLERARVGSGASSGTACMITPSHSDRTASPAALRDGLRFLLDPKAPLKLRPKPSELAWVARFTAASLSEERADAVKQWLVTTMKIAPERIQTVGRGSADALVPADRSVEEQQPNRRVEILIRPLQK